ncbi:multidrug resistance-associated protein 1-like isoform X2 [Mya arenaria]|uniref:multidrug resistance-associated protein 1-like isoform X2 n=1 Tax=Mya arenaria TaxID=6604 RepID=UPI0022DFEB70|nr:multidrug resistance-associated protein 1-like isoform X2 [Mya arenaria]
MLVARDDARLIQDVPEVSPCFEESVLVWVPYGYMWVVLGPYLLYIAHGDRTTPLPWTPLQVAKSCVSGLLFCILLAAVSVTTTSGYRCVLTPEVPHVYYLAIAVKLATFLLVLLLEHYMRINGVKTSGIIFMFWFLAAVCGLLPLYSMATAKVWCTTSTLYVMELILLWIQLLLRCFVDRYKTRGYIDLEHDNPCPEENASVLNKITYSWISSLVVKAYKETLSANDLWDQTTRLRSGRLVPAFLKCWKQSEKRLTQKRKQRVTKYGRFSISYDSSDPYASEQTPLLGSDYEEPTSGHSLTFTHYPDFDDNKGTSIFKVVAKTYGIKWLEACGYKILGDCVNLLQPVILQKIIEIIDNRDNPGAYYPVWMGYCLAVSLFATSMLKTLFWQTCLHNMISLGLSIRVALIGAVYRKALTLSNSAKKTSTVGEIVNLMSVDCQRIQDSLMFSHHIISMPFVIIVGMIQIWGQMGIAMFAGLAFVVVAIIINSIIGRCQQSLQVEILAFKSLRIKILNEVINGIKVLKMYSWEIPFQNKVASIRKEEIKRLWKFALLTAAGIFFSVHSPFMINYLLVLSFTLTRSVHYLDAQTAFVVLSLVNILRSPIVLTPFVVNGVMQGYVSFSRVQAFLWKEDVKEDTVEYTTKGDHVVNVENASFSWTEVDRRPTLNNINLNVDKGEIIAVVGQVGSGKSSLISAILGEMEKRAGHVAIQGKVAYVPQEAWIQNMTVRDNILFGHQWDEVRYSKVLNGCALLQDLEILSGGDMTEIGEKGINISGGQKQRVSLARAVYSDADIYLLDDPLSAVDSHVGKHLFKNVIGSQGLLKHKTRILVTHGIHWLPMVDRILVLNNGEITEAGTYEELISRRGAFANLIQTFLEFDDESDADDTIIEHVKQALDQSGQPITKSGKSPVKRRHRKSTEREKSLGMSFSKDTALKGSELKNEGVSRLTQEEQSQKGSVKWAVFRTYARAMGIIALILVMVFIIGFQSLNVFSNYWLTYWTEDELMKNQSLGQTEEYENRFIYYILWYTVIGVVQGGSIIAFGIFAMTRMVRASGILHNRMLECILRSPMSFFDTTPVGRIINRFSSDIDIMDDRLPLNFRLWNIQIFSTIATIVVVSINTPIFLVAIAPVTIIYLLLLKFYLPTARQVKRMESVLRSPIYNHFSESISGASVIRAYRCMDRFIKESERRVDKNAKFYFAALSAGRWIAVRLETLGNFLILAAAIFALLSDLNGAQVGLSVTYSLQITISLNLVIQAISELEMNIVSAERVSEYTELISEAPWSIPARRPSREWPRTGDIELKMYRTRYREGLELTLKGLNCHIQSAEKIGIVGRTGAGKSSLALSLFRLIEAAGGSIVIDGRNIANMGLHDLRDKLTILPQDPVLFSGSLRENLDPFGRFDDPALWKALECAHLKESVDAMHGQLDYECGEGGSNLSVGQRQLVCLARTLLHKTRILILDEATAAVDLETDELIQETIRREFSECTVLTIAHRLNTVIDYDRVMVLSEGEIVEMDKPGNLLQDANSAFYKMAKDAGIV